MRIGALALAAGLSFLPANAQVRTPEFTVAEAQFNGLDLRARVIAQVLLIASGYQNSVPTEQFGLRTFGALKRFQEENQIWPSGGLNKATTDRLFAVAVPMLNQWDFRLMSHPTRGRSIWIPQGLGLRSSANRNGYTFQDPLDRLKVAYNYFQVPNIEAAYASILEKKQRDGATVHYSVIKDG